MAAAAVAGPNEDGPVLGSAAERKRRRGQRAPFPGRKVEPRASLDRWCLRRSGRAVRAASCRRSFGDGRAERGWTARCCCGGTQAPPRPAGTVPRPEGRA